MTRLWLASADALAHAGTKETFGPVALEGHGLLLGRARVSVPGREAAATS
ncbi:MAG: hypothetical protein ACRES6_05560 [Steroidobacteraceae bacterium]